MPLPTEPPGELAEVFPLHPPTGDRGLGPPAGRGGLVVEDLGAVLDRVEAAGPPGWLIQRLWPADAYGVLAAEDKAGKTWAILDLAVSVGCYAGPYACRWRTPRRLDGRAPLVISLGGVERPRRKVRFARLIHRRVRTFWPAFGRRRLRRQSAPVLVATHGDPRTYRALQVVGGRTGCAWVGDLPCLAGSWVTPLAVWPCAEPGTDPVHGALEDNGRC